MNTILEDAIAATSGDRRRDYGEAEENHVRISNLWNAYMASIGYDIEITPIDVSHMMILLKVARVIGTPTRDSYVDIAGYARCSAQIAGFENE